MWFSEADEGCKEALVAPDGGFIGGRFRQGEEAQMQLLYLRMAIDMVALLGTDRGDVEDGADRVEELLEQTCENGLSASSFQDQLPRPVFQRPQTV